MEALGTATLAMDTRLRYPLPSRKGFERWSQRLLEDRKVPKEAYLVD